jgi:gentisate 1,2-dioxygenase
MTFFMQMLRPGERTLPLKQSANLVFSPFEGAGYSVIADKRIDWERFDTVVVPGGTWCQHVNASDRQPAILFVASDEPTLKALSFYQKHGKNDNGDTVRLT